MPLFRWRKGCWRPRGGRLSRAGLGHGPGSWPWACALAKWGCCGRCPCVGCLVQAVAYTGNCVIRSPLWRRALSAETYWHISTGHRPLWNPFWNQKPGQTAWKRRYWSAVRMDSMKLRHRTAQQGFGYLSAAMLHHRWVGGHRSAVGRAGGAIVRKQQGGWNPRAQKRPGQEC